MIGRGQFRCERIKVVSGAVATVEQNDWTAGPAPVEHLQFDFVLYGNEPDAVRSCVPSTRIVLGEQVARRSQKGSQAGDEHRLEDHDHLGSYCTCGDDGL